MPDTLPAVPGLDEMAPSFLRAFVDQIRPTGLDLDHVAALISHESRFRPDARNAATRATGLIQFMPATAKTLGTSVDELARMSATAQLPFVVAYFKPFGQLAPRDIVIAALGTGLCARGGTGPSSCLGAPDETVVARMPETVYMQNAGLDTDKDGIITLGDVRGQIDAMLAAAARKPRLVVPADGGGPTPASRAPSKAGPGLGFVLLCGLGALALRRLAS